MTEAVHISCPTSRVQSHASARLQGRGARQHRTTYHQSQHVAQPARIERLISPELHTPAVTEKATHHKLSPAPRYYLNPTSSPTSPRSRYRHSLPPSTMGKLSSNLFLLACLLSAAALVSGRPFSPVLLREDPPEDNLAEIVFLYCST